MVKVSGKFLEDVIMWLLKLLGEIAEVQSGGTPLKSKQDYWNGDISWYSSGELNDLYTKESKAKITKKGLQESNAKLFPKGSLLIGMYDTAALKMSILDRDAAFNQAIAGVKPNDDIFDLRFILYTIHSKKLMILNQRRGVRQKNLNLQKIKNIKIPLPPLEEQKRIVTILDEAFEGIDKAILNTQKNLTNAREIFESYLNSIFTNKGDDWVEKKLGDIADFRNGLNFTKNSKGESIKIVGVKDFQNHFWIQEDELETVTIDGQLKEIDRLDKGDILFVRSNGNKELIGRSLLADELSEKTSYSGFTIRMRIREQDIYNPYVVSFLKSKLLRQQLTKSGSGISISSLNQNGLSLIKLSFPSSHKQKSIVNQLDNLREETQRLETIYKRKIEALKELKQSILQKAFTGKL
ncbi:restriction endonuclease subunit S [Crocosphaera sp. XPORK-15E]|uniref:restriction endonuclease subunit S n=1 Tax=Crocosphaera sp. XPORK-15E TaxID=3110247 RepID=UPI002B1EACFC|nr:restriction endonuclease subunit S [Crocosphaera sp. XPORK-15E]MEA5535266.1 restriction endonuclease subunit S [Crocosphaera sp. XPORK-15E]